MFVTSLLIHLASFRSLLMKVDEMISAVSTRNCRPGSTRFSRPLQLSPTIKMNEASQMTLQADFCVPSRTTGKMKCMSFSTSLCALLNILLAFEKGYVTLQSLFMMITSLDASILRLWVMPIILNLDFSKVDSLSRYALTCTNLPLLMSCRLIVPFLRLQSLLKPLMQLLRTKTALNASS